MKIVIVDDRKTDRRWLAHKIAEYMKHRDIKYELRSFESGEAFVAALEQERFDLVFMDIFMDGMTGMTAAQRLRERDMDCRLVFLTTSKDYFQQGYAYMPRHYLVKPATDADFKQAMDNCQIKRQLKVPFLAVVSDRIPLRVNTAELMYVDICSRNPVLHLVGRVLAVSGSFHKVTEPLLADKRFLQCIQGVLVNMDYIEHVADSVFLLKNGERLQIALRKKTALIRQYHAYIFARMEERRTSP